MKDIIKACDPELRLRLLLEIAIIQELAKAITPTYKVHIDYDDQVKLDTVDEFLEAVFAVDECVLNLYRHGVFVGSIYIVLGNDGYDCIADYHTKFEEELAPVFELADLLEEACEPTRL